MYDRTKSLGADFAVSLELFNSPVFSVRLHFQINYKGKNAKATIILARKQNQDNEFSLDTCPLHPGTVNRVPLPGISGCRHVNLTCI